MVCHWPDWNDQSSNVGMQPNFVNYPISEKVFVSQTYLQASLVSLILSEIYDLLNRFNFSILQVVQKKIFDKTARLLTAVLNLSRYYSAVSLNSRSK